jgi:cyanophycin synthetase
MKSQPCLQYRGPWRLVQGHAHGLQQPTLLGRLFIGPVAPEAVARLDAFMAAAQPELEPLQAPADPAGLARRIAAWVCGLQRQANVAVSPHFHAAPAAQGLDGLFEFALPTAAASATQAALDAVVNAANHLLAPQGSTLQDKARTFLAALPAQLRPHAETSFNGFFLLDAAFRMDLPVERRGGLLLLGTGRHLRMMDSSATDATSWLGLTIAQDKQLTSMVLRGLGLPGAVHEVASSPEQAVEIAHRLGYPVVVKPADHDQGRGVAADLRTDATVVRSWHAAAAISKKVLVEKHFDGLGHRITVLYGEVIGVIRRWPGGVTGDGVHTVEQLVALRERPSEVHGSRTMGRLTLDAEALEMVQEQGLTLQSVPAAGREVRMRRRDNVSTGGGYEHLPPEALHPDNLALACRAARALGLDLSGIDLLSPDITRPWHETGALLCEVNAKPQFVPGPSGRMFDRALARIVGEPAAIPFHVLLVPDPDAPDVLQQLQERQAAPGGQALACRQGVWLDGRRHTMAFPDGWRAARAALRDRDVGSLVAAFSPAEVLAHGLPAHRVDSVSVAQGFGPQDQAALDEALSWCAAAPRA